jgi:hypothetical protein
MIAAIAAVATVLIAVLKGSPTRVGVAPASAVAIIARSVRNEAEEAYEPQPDRLAVRQTFDSTPTIDIEIRNSSTMPAFVSGVTAQIEAYAHVRLCFSQGSGGASIEPAPTVIMLPQYPLSSEGPAFSHLHYEVPGGQSLDIPVRFSVRAAGSTEFSLYRLRVGLSLHGTRTSLIAGDFILSAPAQVPVTDGFFPVDNSYFQQFRSAPFKGSWFDVSWCMRRNAAQVQALMTAPAGRASELEVLKRPVIASEWVEMEDRTPPRRAAERLLSGGFEAEEAVFAATLTHDHAFEDEIRIRAAAQVLKLARGQLADPASPGSQGELDTRLALSIDPTQAGFSLLSEFQRRAEAAVAKAEAPSQ